MKLIEPHEMNFYTEATSGKRIYDICPSQVNSLSMKP